MKILTKMKMNFENINKMENEPMEILTKKKRIRKIRINRKKRKRRKMKIKSIWKNK